MGRRPNTDLLNSAEFGCSEENKSCSGGYPELINGCLVTGSTGLERRPTPMLPVTKQQPPKHFKSNQDTLLSNFCFLHYIQVLHCLKDQWWAFGSPLWASGPQMNAYIGSDDLRGHGKTFLFFDFYS